MSWVAVAIGGSAILGAVTSGQAAHAQAGAGQDALNFQAATDDKNRYLLEPFDRMGMYAASAYNNAMGVGDNGQLDLNAPLSRKFTLADFQESPNYQWNLQQGQAAIDKAAAARGNLYAPATLQDLSKYSQGLASNEFQNSLNNYRNWQSDVSGRLQGMANMGVGAGGALAGVSANMSNSMANTMQGMGNARAAGYMGMGNAIQGGIGSLVNYNMQQQMLNQMQNGAYQNYSQYMP